MVGRKHSPAESVLLLVWSMYTLLAPLFQEAETAPLPTSNCTARRIESRELLPSFCPDGFSVVIWKVCPHPTPGGCVEGYLSVPFMGMDRQLQLRHHKKALRSNEIFRMKRLQMLAADNRLRPFYSLRTADNRCVDVDANGYLVAKDSNSEDCSTRFRDFGPSSSVLTAAPRRICVLENRDGGTNSAYVVRFNRHGHQSPLQVDNPENCTHVPHRRKSTCEDVNADLEIGNLLGLTKHNLQGTAFRLFYVMEFFSGKGEIAGSSCTGILSDDIMDCCNLREKC